MGWDFFTWLSIGVLVVVSLLVFAWFAVDVRRMHRDVQAGQSPYRSDDPE